MRTVPDLFLRPGRLARDYMENRIARHVPPFRTFLVALLIFIFATEHATHEIGEANTRQQQRHAAAMATPQGRAAEAASIRAEAAGDRDQDLKDAAKDLRDDLNDPDENRARAQAAYAREAAKLNARYGDALARADRVAAGLPEPPERANPRRSNWFKAGMRKATANPEYYLTVVFTWGHRIAFLLLPIVGLSLALVYRDKRRYFLYDHLLVAMNLLSFAFLANALGFVLPLSWMPWWLGVVALWTPVNLFQTLRGGYGSGVPGAVVKTLVVWITTVTAFGALVIGLLVFTLTQI